VRARIADTEHIADTEMIESHPLESFELRT